MGLVAEMTEFFKATPLDEFEIRQLQELPLKYLAYHAAGFANLAVDSILSRFRGTNLIEHPPQGALNATEKDFPRRK
jgi:hypothetical protein